MRCHPAHGSRAANGMEPALEARTIEPWATACGAEGREAPSSRRTLSPCPLGVAPRGGKLAIWRIIELPMQVSEQVQRIVTAARLATLGGRT